MDIHVLSKTAVHLSILIAVFTIGNGATGFDVETFEAKVDEYIKAGLACRDNPGLSLSVVRDGKVVLAKGYGFKTRDKLEPVTNRTLFGIASLSKAFASALLLKQIEENKTLSLSTTIRTILGDDVLYGYQRQRYTTLEDLLSHRTGVPSNNAIRLDNTFNRQTVVKRLRYLKPYGGFRTSYYYNNLMYGLVTYMSEVLGKSSWEDLVKTKLFDRLGMTDSAFVTTADPHKLDLASGYVEYGGNMYPVPFEFTRRWGDLCGSGCVLSNSLDMAKWLLFHLNGGRNQQNEQVLDSDMLEHAHSPQNPISPSTKYYVRPITPATFSTHDYGMGWRVGNYRGFPILTHTGSTYGYRAIATLIPSLNVGIFTGMTGDDRSYLFRTNIHLYLADLLTGDQPWLNTTTVCTFPEPWQKRKPSSWTPVQKDIKATRDLYDYTGVYRNTGYGTLEIYVNSSTNLLMVSYGFGQMILYPKSNADEFYGEGFGIMKYIRDYSTFRFQNEAASGNITSLSVPSFESKVPPVFKLISGRSHVRKRSNGASGLVSGNIVWLLALCLFRGTFLMS